MSQHITIIDIERVRGDNYPFYFQLFQVDGTTPENITGFSFLMTVDPSQDPVDAINNHFQLTGVVSDGPNGKFNFVPTAANMDLPIDTHYHDVQMTDGTPYIRTVIRGKLIIEQDITK